MIDTDVMVPSACQGIVGVTVRADSTELRELLAAIEDPVAKAVSNAERALLAALDGSCATPIGGYARRCRAGACISPAWSPAPTARSCCGARGVRFADAERAGMELGDEPAEG